MATGLEVHLIADNYGTHQHPKVKAWLVRHPRYHLHYTPTYSSWLNQVKRWFGLITQQAIRRGSRDAGAVQSARAAARGARTWRALGVRVPAQRNALPVCLF